MQFCNGKPFEVSGSKYWVHAMMVLTFLAVKNGHAMVVLLFLSRMGMLWWYPSCCKEWIGSRGGGRWQQEARIEDLPIWKCRYRANLSLSQENIIKACNIILLVRQSKFYFYILALPCFTSNSGDWLLWIISCSLCRFEIFHWWHSLRVRNSEQP